MGETVGQTKLYIIFITRVSVKERIWRRGKLNLKKKKTVICISVPRIA